MPLTARRRLGVAAGSIVAVLLLLLLLALGWSRFDRGVEQTWAGWGTDPVRVTLEPGLPAGSMLERLGDAGVLRDPQAVRLWLRLRGGAGRLQAGEYLFDRPLSARDVIARLERGDVLLHPITLPEGLAAREIGERFEQAGWGPARRFEELFADPTPILDLEPEATDLEGYLFPDTYHFRRGESPQRIVRTMVRRFREVADEDWIRAVDQVGLTPGQAVVLASLIEKETSVAEERSRISRVFHNRLERGMRLECDPTVIYALEREGKTVGRLTYAHLRFESPWNTYVVSGLPRGPICNPGGASLVAAVRPSAGEDLYFVASPAGGHVFSETLAAHRRAATVWRRHVRSSR